MDHGDRWVCSERGGLCVWVVAANPGTMFGDRGNTAAALQLCLLGNGSHTALQVKEHPEREHAQQNQ